MKYRFTLSPWLLQNPEDLIYCQTTLKAFWGGSMFKTSFKGFVCRFNSSLHVRVTFSAFFSGAQAQGRCFTLSSIYAVKPWLCTINFS